MNYLKQKYIQRVIRTFMDGSYSDRVNHKVWRWITEDSHADLKEQAIDQEWKVEGKMDENDETEMAYDRWRAKQKMTTSMKKLRFQSKRSLRIWQGVAASLFIGLMVTGAFLIANREQAPQMLQAYCQPGDVMQVELPDGSDVMLNGSSTLVYPERFSSKEREVILIGEGNFQVKANKSHPFIVKCDELSVTALGTEFNIKAYPHHSTVESTLISGSVKVNYGEAGESLLNPCEQLTYDRLTKQATISQIYLKDVTAWQVGELAFSNASLSEIFEEVQNHFPQTFIYDPSVLSTERYTFNFPKDTSLPQMMQIIADVAGDIQVKVDDRQCRVTPK